MVFERTSSQSTVNVICETGDKPIMSSVAVNCCSVPQNWSTMPSDVINTISQPNQTLVVEDNERAAKADGVTKELPHINGGPVPRSFAVHVQAAQAARHKFTIPRIPTAPAFPTFVPNAVHSANAGCSGDTVDTSASTLQVKTKLKSFTDGKEYYHDARFLQTEICNSHLGSSGEPIERDDEGEHPRDDNVHPRRPDLKEGSAMYVDLPQKPLRADVQHVALEMLVDRHNDQPKEHKCLKHPHNNNKEYEEEESSCIVECLYCCIQCCDCSIM